MTKSQHPAPARREYLGNMRPNKTYQERTAYWRSIRGYKGLYAVSKSGRIKSLERVSSFNDKGTVRPRRLREKLLKIFPATDGYLLVNLSKNGKARRHYVHVLVARAFVPNPNSLPEVNHKDLDKTNNRVGNLEWVTHAGNMKHSADNNAHCYGEQHPNARLTWWEVGRMRKLYESGKRTRRQLAKRFNTSVHNVKLITQYKAWRHR